MTTESLCFWLGFHVVPGVGPARLRRLLTYFGDVERAWTAPQQALWEAGLDRRSAENLIATRARVDLADLMRRVRASGAQALTWDDPRYPRLLRQIDAPPPVLFAKGDLVEADRRAVAVVGTRRPSGYGKDVARHLVGELARHQITVVSGLARGIDAVAHRAALEAGGRTIAVLGSGVDRIYPAEHHDLARAIQTSGAVVSDYLPGTPPDAVNFPPRNRIISGLSLGTIVVESGETSGALITARFALEQGREVFAVPGSINARTSVGPHRLIQQGAKLVCTVEDILEELQLHAGPRTTEPVQVTLWPDPIESRVLDALALGPLHADELGRQTGLAASQIASALVVLELQGRVRHVGAMQYVAA